MAQTDEENKALARAAELGEVRAMLRLGENLVLQHDYAGAKKWLERAATQKNQPRDAAEANRLLALNAIPLQEDRLAHLDAAAELQKDCAGCLLDRGIARWEEGKFERACSDFSKALDLARAKSDPAPFVPDDDVKAEAKERLSKC
jgi:TPR repeat protein